MRELFDITPHSTGPGFRMRLKTGEIDVPDRQGGYIISSGCGSGKTESIKSLIRQKYNEGILYCVDTRSELRKMYDWIRENLIDGQPGKRGVLSADEVMIISSDREYSYFLDRYRDNPEILMEKKVILITHVRFWTDLINYFLIYKPREEVAPFDGDFRGLMQRGDLRRYILFDETPTFITPFFEFDRMLLGLFSTVNADGHMVCRPPEEIRSFYDCFMKGRKDLFNQTYRINRIKKDVVLGLIPKYYDSWMLSGCDRIGITFYPADLCPEGIGICTHVLVFEGAGDILLKGSRNFQLLDVESKYDSVTEFRKVEFGIARKGGRDEARFGRFMDRISELIDRSTLVVCWKDVDDEDLGNGKSEYAERTRRELLERGVSPALLNVTYYGSADNKSTNSYRDAQQIVLCGDWSLVNAETAKIRRAYGTTTTPREHKEWYFSQLITRIGIRKHEKGSYTVFYTDDFDERFIAGMELYFNGNKVPDSGNRKQKDWKDKLEGMKIRSNIKDEIILLAKYDRDMQNAIVMEQEYTKEATFYYLEEILGIKRCARERIRYKSLINTLSRMKITLLIK